ncbi:EamA family transporter [Rhizobium grahamii]|uniref:EamA family transporter n=1 Tax=Rhizobium grahamii TaxID=1120045 RepID=A0A5Q0C3J0_9HYPH|nr:MULTISPECIES: DMT family transporter [Rhizobium]QFY60468.1 EamA family transporter [Rhizobium grahamii]QRM50404.1 EamA family transporter [Rhizobium sp. BG6]
MSDRIRISGEGGVASVLQWRPGLADLQVIAAALLAGSGWIFSTNALKELPPLFFIGSRFLLAGVLIGAFARMPSGGWKLRELGYLALAAVALALSMTGWIVALAHTAHIGVAAFITATGNLIVPLVGAVMFRWRLPPGFLASAALALVGLSFLFLDRSSAFDASHFIFLGSALLWALNIALVKNTKAQMGIAGLTATQLIISGAIILGASWLVETPPSMPPSLAASGWFLASVVLSTCARFVLQFRGQQSLPPGRAATLMAFEPIWAMTLTVALFGASISVAQAVGCAVIFFAIAREVSRSADVAAATSATSKMHPKHINTKD